jgi:hypothetical protein
MKTTFTPQERDAFAKAVSAVEGIYFSPDDDRFFQSLLSLKEKPDTIMERVISRALDKA